jgi:aspartyl-tRNA(Asn)/glutamyl-tRNA(Gln) amidotransferase subunit B
MTGESFEAVIGLEIHAELETQSKMFCACPVVDSTVSEPNIAVCPVCAGMPGVLPVVNRRAVEYGLRVALALECQVNHTSLFARKNYFYPDLPKGYQISQYEQPLARHGRLAIVTPQGERVIRVRRVHLEEDTGKLTHVTRDGQSYSLVDLNRAGVPLLEIVSEPDLHTPEEVRQYAVALRAILRYLGVNSGDMQKGVMRIEPNVSVRPLGSTELGTRTEIKNLNSFRALERGVAFEIQRQVDLIRKGGQVVQETRGWDEARGVTFPQRVKEGEDDYRYFPEPDLPPLVVEAEWVEQIRRTQPELPAERYQRFQKQYELGSYDSAVLTLEPRVADYFEQAAAQAAPKTIANWISGDLFALMNQAGLGIEEIRVKPEALAGLTRLVATGTINQNTAKSVLAEMFESGETAEQIVDRRGLKQVSDADQVAALVEQVLAEYPDQVASYLAGKETVSRWLFGQVMRLAKGQANPQVIQQVLDERLLALKNLSPPEKM